MQCTTTLSSGAQYTSSPSEWGQESSEVSDPRHSTFERCGASTPQRPAPRQSRRTGSAPEKPIDLHATTAAPSPKPSAHTGAHSPDRNTSSLPTPSMHWQARNSWRTCKIARAVSPCRKHGPHNGRRLGLGTLGEVPRNSWRTCEIARAVSPCRKPTAHCTRQGQTRRAWAPYAQLTRRHRNRLQAQHHAAADETHDLSYLQRADQLATRNSAHMSGTIGLLATHVKSLFCSSLCFLHAAN